MAGNLTLSLLTARSGLLTNQQALDTVANNIANVNSPGYSRKIVNTEARVVDTVGAGVQISSITRQVDEGLLKSVRQELSALSELASKDNFFARVEELFGRPADNGSISHIIENFTVALETLAVSPDKALDQSELARQGADLTDKLKQMNDTLQELRQQADQLIADGVAEMNAQVSRISDFNDKIVRNSVARIDVSDLRDQRDVAIDKLAQLVDIRYFLRNDGDVVIFTSTGKTLVDNQPATFTHNAASTVSATTTHSEGDISGIFAGAAVAANDITGTLKTGRLKGLIELRDGILPGLQAQVDELAAELRDVFNQIHNRGAPFPGMQTLSGTRNLIRDVSNGAQVDTITLTGTVETGGDSYTITINGTPVTYNVTGGEANLAAVRDALVAAINANGTVNTVITAAAGAAAGQLTLTSDTAGTSFTTLAATNNGGVTNDNTAAVATTTANTVALTQTIQIDPTNAAADVGIVLFDSTGNQSALTTLDTIMTSAIYGTGAQTTHGAWSITEVAATIQDWLRANGASTATAAVNAAGKFTIALNTTSLNLAFRDETATASGSTHSDIEIGFNSDGIAGNDETVRGFSNFFGFNDFFVDGLTDAVHESNVITSTFQASAATLNFSDSNGPMSGSPLVIPALTTLTDLAALITTSVTNVTATVVPDGGGQRLRISHDSGSNVVVTQAASNTLLTDIGMHVADVRVSGALKVRADIRATPANISRGAAQWNANLGPAGEYFASIADDTIIKALAEQFTSTNAFDKAGDLPDLTLTFSQYAAGILSGNAKLAERNKTDLGFQQTLTDSLKGKSDNVRGVNLDEELAQLILLEQAYAASARIISVIQEMFDTLDRVFG